MLPMGKGLVKFPQRCSIVHTVKTFIKWTADSVLGTYPIAVCPVNFSPVEAMEAHGLPNIPTESSLFVLEQQVP